MSMRRARMSSLASAVGVGLLGVLVAVGAAGCRREVSHPMASGTGGTDGGADRGASGGSSHDATVVDGSTWLDAAGLDGGLPIPRQPRRRLVIGGQRACALGDDGWIRCWGSDIDLFDARRPTSTDGASPVAVMQAGQGAVDFGAGDEGLCALKAEGSVYCRGFSQDGILTGIGGPSVALAVGGNGRFACAIRVDGAVFCAPANSIWQNPLGDGPDVLRAPDLDSAVDIVASDGACARRADGTVWCWGGGRGDVTPNDGSSNGERPRRVPELGSDVVALAAGGGGVCASKRDGSVQCWGRLFGDPEIVPYPNPPQPRTFAFLAGARKIAVGDTHACAIDGQGKLVCFGANDLGQLGDGTFALRATPAPVVGIDGGAVTDLAAGAQLTCAALQGGAVRCFGNNDRGALGDGSALALVARPVATAGAVQTFTAADGTGTASAVLADGAVQVWGVVTTSLIGGAPARLARPLDLTTPATAPAASTATVNGASACLLTTAGAVMCTTDASRTSVPAALHVVSGLESDVAVLTGLCAIRANGTGGCLGTASGALGPLPTLSPGTTATIKDLDFVWGGAGCVLLSDGSIQCWRPINATSTDPVDQFGGVATRLSASGQACAVRSDGAVLCWPLEELSHTAAALVPLPSPCVGVSAGYEHSCAWSADGQVFCWGSNQYGQLGDGTFTNRLTPIRSTLPPGPVRAVSAGTKQTCVTLAADGSLWCWGWNGAGELGDGTGGPRALPTTVALP